MFQVISIQEAQSDLRPPSFALTTAEIGLEDVTGRKKRINGQEVERENEG
jgi:hypothetical protein